MRRTRTLLKRGQRVSDNLKESKKLMRDSSKIDKLLTKNVQPSKKTMIKRKLSVNKSMKNFVRRTRNYNKRSLSRACPNK